MKFRFNGGQDCPDWVLAEMNTLSRLTSIKTRLLASKVSENIVMSSTDEELLASAKQLTEDAKFQINDVKAAIAALNFILATSAKYETPSNVLENELYQLGLPKEHANALCKIYTKVQKTLEQNLIQQSLQSNRKKVTFQPSKDDHGKIVCTISEMSPDKDLDTRKVIMTINQFRMILSDLQRIRETLL